jgi:hypothetical protein
MLSKKKNLFVVYSLHVLDKKVGSTCMGEPKACSSVVTIHPDKSEKQPQGFVSVTEVISLLNAPCKCMVEGPASS